MNSLWFSDRTTVAQPQKSKIKPRPPRQIDLLQPLRQWLDRIEISDPTLAKILYKAIPAQCPFERDIVLFDRKIAHIPPMCKLNPFYDQLVGLRFRALCYLVDQCGMEIS